jgi:Ca2+-binding EF-hand superfamily protein
VLYDAEKYFNTLDKDNSGTISREELKAALKANGVPTTPALVDSIMKKIDLSGDGKITKDEFMLFSNV